MSEQKTAEELEVENARLRQAYDYILSSRNSVDKELNEANQQLAAYRESLGEMIPIADYYHDREVTYTGMPYKTWNDIIDRAKKLLDKQPQSESDGDKNL